MIQAAQWRGFPSEAVRNAFVAALGSALGSSAQLRIARGLKIDLDDGKATPGVRPTSMTAYARGFVSGAPTGRNALRDAVIGGWVGMSMGVIDATRKRQEGLLSAAVPAHVEAFNVRLSNGLSNYEELQAGELNADVHQAALASLATNLLRLDA